MIENPISDLVVIAHSNQHGWSLPSVEGTHTTNNTIIIKSYNDLTCTQYILRFVIGFEM